MALCGIYRILQFDTAFIYGKISVWRNGQDISALCQYSWSNDGVCWTGWADYNTYNTLCANIETDQYWRVRINGELTAVMIDNAPTTCYSMQMDAQNAFLTNFCEDPNLFNPYLNLDCALLLQQQTADSIICMFGIPIYYFAVDPDKSTGEYTFKEYLLHNVKGVKQLKLMLQDGQMPSSKPIFNDDDFFWDTEWEVELSKTQFATAFGDTAFPKQRDIIYVPLMKRLWTVNSAYDEKQEGFMWRSTTWKLALTKYNNNENVDEGDFGQLIQSFVDHTYYGTLGKYEDAEQLRESGYASVDAPNNRPNSISNVFMQDALRAQVTMSLVNISQLQLNQKSNIIARNAYHFQEGGQVIYQPQPCMDNGSLSFILKLPASGTEGKWTMFEYGTVKTELEYNNGWRIHFGTLALALPYGSTDTYLINCRWNKGNFTSDLTAYPYTHRDIDSRLLKPSMWYFDVASGDTVMGAYNPDYAQNTPTQCRLLAIPAQVTNIKLFNTALDTEKLINESLKYTTNEATCIINDLARPIETGLGFAIK